MQDRCAAVLCGGGGVMVNAKDFSSIIWLIACPFFRPVSFLVNAEEVLWDEVGEKQKDLQYIYCLVWEDNCTSQTNQLRDKLGFNTLVVVFFSFSTF